MTDHAPLTDEEVSAMTEYWTSPTGVAQAPPGMVEYARLCVDRLTADLRASQAEVERLRSFVDILSRKVDVYETQASDAGPYMLLHWTDDIRHAEPCDCDLDNETAGEACMANSEWTYAVCVDGGAFAPRLILTLPRRPPEQPDHDGPPLLAIPDPMPELSPELQRRLSHRTAQDARFHALCHIVAGVFDLKDQHGKPLDQAVYAAHVLREALLNAGLTIS